MPIDVDRDEHGNEHVAGEALLVGGPQEVAAAVAHGYVVLSEQTLASLNRTAVRLHVPGNLTVDQAILQLRSVAPRATVTPNSIYRDAQSFVARSSATPSARSTTSGAGELGIIDTGADAAVLSQGALTGFRAFAPGAYTARDHGTLVASLASRMGMRVRVADVFGVDRGGTLAASADAIAGALDWMIVNNVAVINISIEGPRNAILERLVRTATQRGHVIVAAAGNGGPLAAPAFPAAYDGAVAVTAIDDTGHAYRRANRGDYVAFAAPGVNVDVAVGDHAMTVSGTSFSAPIVASKIASQLRAPSPSDARRVLRNLQRDAVDLGAPGRDPVFGWGAVADED